MPGSDDPQLDLIYSAIGNPCPDIAGEERIGDNLYTSSVVALAAKTGEMKWYYQFTPHDTHDWDAVQPMSRGRDVGGKPRKLLMHGDRNGMFYVLDRTNGQVLRTANLSTKVTWHKGFTADGKPIVDPGSIATKEGIAACPAGGGGANFQAQSYNPLTKLFYARVSDSCGIYTSHDDPLGATGNRWFGRGTPSDKAREQLAALTKGYETGVFIRAIIRSAARKCGISGACRAFGRALDRRRPDLPWRGRRPARRRSEIRQAALERQHLSDHPRVANDVHGWRQAIRRTGRNKLHYRLRSLLESIRGRTGCSHVALTFSRVVLTFRSAVTLMAPIHLLPARPASLGLALAAAAPCCRSSPLQNRDVESVECAFRERQAGGLAGEPARHQSRAWRRAETVWRPPPRNWRSWRHDSGTSRGCCRAETTIPPHDLVPAREKLNQRLNVSVKRGGVTVRAPSRGGRDNR